MPRKPEPSFRLKEIIWDLAATTGAENFSALYKDLDYKLEELRKDKDVDFFEDTPDIRTIQRIVELDINRLLPEVVISKLPTHVWHLRHDYEKIKELADSVKTVQTKNKKTNENPKLTKHLNELEKTAETLAHQCRRLLRYKDNANIKARGDVITKLLFWNEQTREFVVEGLTSEDYAESIYEDKHRIDPYLADLLYIHYEGQFGALQFRLWNQLSTANISPEIVNNLEILAHGGLEPCSKCSICRKYKGI